MVYLKSVENVITLGKLIGLLLPVRASEQGNVIGSVRVIERTRDLIYLKFVATDFFPKIISLSGGENSVT